MLWGRRKWVLISHLLNENPFAAAFMDWKVQMRLFRVTITSTTLVEWSCTFKTEPHVRLIPRATAWFSLRFVHLGCSFSSNTLPCGPVWVGLSMAALLRLWM